jgi:hypothetical protein
MHKSLWPLPFRKNTRIIYSVAITIFLQIKPIFSSCDLNDKHCISTLHATQIYLNGVIWTNNIQNSKNWHNQTCSSKYNHDNTHINWH